MDNLRALVFAYVASLVTMLALDAAWLGAMYRRLYKPALGDMLRQSPLFPPAIAFYLLYALGVTVLVVAGAAACASVARALVFGGLLGLLAYGTYDLSNYATLRAWPLSLTIADMAWGAFVTSMAALAGYYAARTFG